MTAKTSGSSELQFECRLRATRARVWAAITEAKQIQLWYGPSDDFRVEVKEWECRVGGGYRVSMHDKDGQTHTCFGVFKTVDRERRVAYTWSWEGAPPMETLVTFEIEGANGETLLKLTHTGFPSEEATERHRMGWTGSLARLERAVA